jgi:hypothetical protein
MSFTERVEKLLASNHIKEVIDEFLKFLNEVPQSNIDAKSDANQLKGQIIILSGRFTDLNTKINTNSIDSENAGHEKSALLNSFMQILNQIPSNYPDLNQYLQEKNEEDEWKDAQNKNTIDAYHAYFNKYPNGKYKADTIKLIAELEDVKLKQDNEIKRLALLEKERRESDRVAEMQRMQQAATNAGQPYKPEVTTVPPPGKSKKGLFIGIGIAVIVLIIILLSTGNNSTSDENTTPESEEAVDSTSQQSDSTYDATDSTSEAPADSNAEPANSGNENPAESPNETPAESSESTP